MSWSGVKRQISVDIKGIEAWCDEMWIMKYTINDKGEIDVDGNVDLYKEEFDILPYKFGRVSGYFTLSNNKNLISLKNCPDYVDWFFRCDECPQLDSLEGCPKEVDGNFYCMNCKKEFVEEEVRALCEVKIPFDIYC